MGVGILAPVPASVLGAALETCRREGRVAFGTNDLSVFEKAAEEYGYGLPVLICPTGQPSSGPSGYATFRAVHAGKADGINGNHPNPKLRPNVEDTGWDHFWEVEDLEETQEQIAIGSLSSARTGEPVKGWRRPMLVQAPFL